MKWIKKKPLYYYDKKMVQSRLINILLLDFLHLLRCSKTVFKHKLGGVAVCLRASLDPGSFSASLVHGPWGQCCVRAFLCRGQHCRSLFIIIIDRFYIVHSLLSSRIIALACDST